MANRKFQISSQERKDRNKRSTTKRLFGFRLFSLICLLFLFFIIFPLAKNYNRKRMVNQELTEIKEEIRKFEVKNQELRELIAYLESDSSLEEQARLNFGLKRPGEEVVVIDNLSFEQRQLEEVIINDKANWQKWFDYFFVK